jgi:hypothetical protein
MTFVPATTKCTAGALAAPGSWLLPCSSAKVAARTCRPGIRTPTALMAGTPAGVRCQGVWGTHTNMLPHEQLDANLLAALRAIPGRPQLNYNDKLTSAILSMFLLADCEHHRSLRGNPATHCNTNTALTTAVRRMGLLRRDVCCCVSHATRHPPVFQSTPGSRLQDAFYRTANGLQLLNGW